MKRGVPYPQTVWPIFTLVILIAFFFRFYRLADHPLGLFFDPAINGLDTLRLIQRGGLTLFFPTNGGRESLFMYLLVPLVWLFGPIPLSLRLLTATISLLNVVFLFAFLYDLHFTFILAWSRRHRLWLAGTGGLILATMSWHIGVSRLGQRPILVPMLAVPIFWLFLKGWHQGQKRWFILSGLLMGLGGYTYPAVRLLPVILVLALLPELLLKVWPPRVTVGAPGLPTSRPPGLQTRLRNFLLFGLAALIVYLPMGSYLLAHPALFGARAFTVMVWHFLDTPADIAAEIGRNLLRVAAFFCCQGSPNPIFGLPGYPGLSLLLTPFLILGLLVALKNWRDFFHRLVALWWLVGLIPSIIAIEAPHPLRMIVALPATAILVALGFLSLYHWSLRLSPPTPHTSKSTHHAPRTTFYLPFLLILLTLPFTFTAYFITWPRLPVTQGIYDYGAIAIRDTVFDLASEARPIYLPLSRYNDSTLLYYLGQAFPRQANLTVSPAAKAVVISPEKNMADPAWVRLYQETATILPPLTEEGQRLIQEALAQAEAQPIRTGRGETVARLASLADDPARFVEELAQPLDVSFGPMRLVGATYSQEITASRELPVTLFWQANETMNEEYEVLVRLVDDQWRAYGNGDGRPTDWVYPTTFWRPGQDTVAARQTVKLENSDLPPGRYWLAVSVFDPVLNRLLPLNPGSGESPDTFLIGPLKVPLTPPSLEQTHPLSPQQVRFGEVIQLAGTAITGPAATPGETLEINLLWKALDRPEREYTVFVHLLDPEGQWIAGHDTQPLAGHYPTSIWSAGELILDRHLLPLPADLRPGTYQLAVGLYHQPTGERLAVLLPDGSLAAEGRLTLEPEVTVQAP